MKTKIKRHSRAVLSVILAVSMLISCMTVGLIATDAARVNDEAVGYSGCKVKGTWDSWKLHDITSGYYTVSLAANTTYSFVFVAENNDQFSSNTTIKNSTDYNFSRNDNDTITLQTAAAGTYTFSFKGFDGGQTSMTVHIEYPEDTSETTWTAVGDNTAIFGTAWAPTATANDLTKDSGTTWSKTWNGVQLSAGTIKYKVAKNHAWTTTYPASDATKTVSSPGLYNVTVTYNESNNAVSMTLTAAATYTLTVGSVNNAVVKATYNGTTANEGGTITNIPQGSTVSVSVTPDTGYQCTGITSTGGGTTSGSMYSFTLTMPGANTTVGANITTVSLKKIYFNNSYTLYGSVYAYVYDKSGSDKTYEYLGAYPGTTMTKLDNSNVWYIEVPSDVDYVEFVSGEGYRTGEMSIPWSSYTYPKYTAPYGYNSAPTPSNGGTWGNYIYGSNNKRTNEYTVSKGSTMNASNLFTGITATMYDYYTDGEVADGWINGIKNTEYTGTGNGWTWNPYTKLNSALSSYANKTTQPKYDVTYPLYFGNLNTWSDNGNGNAIGNVGNSSKDTITSYYNWNLNANNSVQLSSPNNAVTGLTGKTLANDTIHYYKSDATNENGAPMAMFDEDFLSGENNQSKALASILRTSSFPVRKTNVYSTIYFNAANCAWTFNDGDSVYAYFWNGSSNIKVAGSRSGNIVTFTIPTGYADGKVLFYRSNTKDGTWHNQSPDLTVPTTSSNKYNINSDFNGGSWGTYGSGTTPGSHVYYEYDSTNGKDNAYIENISKTNKTAQINYYNNTNKVHSNSNTDGFFPFNRNNLLNSEYAQDLGFGMKLTIPFNLEGSGSSNGINTDGTDQTFDFSGDDDLWVFVDGKLVLDLGGAHGRTTGSINFHTKTITATNTQAIGSATRNVSFADGFNKNENYVHTMTIYYMERGMYDSNLKFGFSFHAIPNQFWIDKKIRTKDIINAGFYQNNEQTGSASNKDDAMTTQEGRFISKFEASYQNEAFTVTHKYGPSAAEATTPASGKNYTIDNDTNTYTTPAAGTYPIKHDLGNAFIGQFTTGQYFNLKESYGSNKYVYTPQFSVWDQANNNQAITATGDNTSGYTFRFNPTTAATGGIENTNIKARFENYMTAHTLTLTKKTNNPSDTTSEFTLEVKFDFENDGNYIAYPLYCDLDGVRTQLSKTGQITIKQGQILEIEEIPENAKIQVTEVLPAETSPYAYSGIDLATMSGTSFNPDATLSNGVQFVLHSNDIMATVNNTRADAVIISHQLKPGSVGKADTYVTAAVTDSTGSTTRETYAKTPGRITVDPQYIKRNSTDKLVITLETTPIGAYAFEHFWEQITSTMNQLAESGTPYTAVIEEDRMRATVTVTIGDLFNGTGAQLYTELPFYSSLLDLQRNLTITKKLTSGTDATSTFNINITKNGSAYSGSYKLNGTAATTATGIISVHQDDVITIEGLRVGENVAVFETDIPFNYEFSKATLGTDDNTNVASKSSTGYAYTVSENTALKIWNAPITYHYSITYAYDSYRGLHKTQKYRVTGDFDKNTAKVADYLKVSNTVYDDDTKANVTSYWFKDDTARKNFINILGPYENNYMEKLYWNTDMKSASNTEGVSIVYNSKNHTYTIDVNVVASKQKFVDLTFRLPYNHDVRSTAYAAKETDGKVLYNNALPDETISNLDYGTWFAQNGVKYGDKGVPQYVSAPMVIYNGEQPMGFKYWTVKTVAKDSYPSVEYTKCYYHDFNLSIYQDSIVEPHYENITAEQAANYHPNPHDVAMQNGNANGAVVTFLENSRNQYNVTNNNISQASRKNRGDRIYTDFLLSYASEGDLKFQDYADGEYTAGLAIQKVALLDNKTGGEEGKNTDSAYYANKYGNNLNNMTYNGSAFSKSTLESFIKGNASYNDSIGLERSQFDANKLDNKNRIQYYYSYSVRSHTDLTDNGNKDYVYRAFAYMKDKNGNVTMVSQPLYFTFYDMASIANAQVGYNSDFPNP